MPTRASSIERSAISVANCVSHEKDPSKDGVHARLAGGGVLGRTEEPELRNSTDAPSAASAASAPVVSPTDLIRGRRWRTLSNRNIGSLLLHDRIAALKRRRSPCWMPSWCKAIRKSSRQLAETPLKIGPKARAVALRRPSLQFSKPAVRHDLLKRRPMPLSLTKTPRG
jgi:hypothetical protein